MFDSVHDNVVWLALGLTLGLAGCGGNGNCAVPPDDFQGVWREVAAISCADGAEFRGPEGLIGDVQFWCNLRLDLTWQPVGLHFDYWGPYEYDAASGAFSMTIADGNNIPDDADLSGTIELLEDGTLRLSDFDFGAAPFDTPGRPADVCGHILEFVSARRR